MDFPSYWQAVKDYSGHSQAQQSFITKTLSLSPGQRAVVSNGQLIGPFDEGEEFTQDDFSLLDKLSSGTLVDKIVHIVKKRKLESKK